MSMSSSTPIVIAAGLLAGAVLLSSRADSQAPAPGKFLGVGVSDNGSVAWRVDSMTGEMMQCTASPSVQRIVCLRQ
jgi:hypothetical protein